MAVGFLLNKQVQVSEHFDITPSRRKVTVPWQHTQAARTNNIILLTPNILAK